MVIGLLTDFFGTLLTGLGLRSTDPNKKYKYYRVAIYALLVAVLTLFLAVIIYPVSFSKDVAKDTENNIYNGYKVEPATTIGDLDYDNDGIIDSEDDDDDNDGVLDDVDDDDDNDGIPDSVDSDDDNDGIPDELDDPSLTRVEVDEAPPPPLDTDGDSIPDVDDPDIDNDGILNVNDDDDDGDNVADEDDFRAGGQREFSWGFGYGAAWCCLIFIFISVVLLICDRESEEIFYKERPVEEDEEEEA